MSDETICRALDTADHCHATITRRGEQDACGKPPVALIAETGEFAELDGSPTFWPACAWHANRCVGPERHVLSLMQIMAAIRQRPAAPVDRDLPSLAHASTLWEAT